MVEYIEREALLKQMRANFQQASWYGCDEPMYPIVEETIYESPAANVAPVVHGRWVNRKVHGINYRICSVCGEYRPALNEFGKVAKRNYCPNCGAKMDKESNDGV